MPLKHSTETLLVFVLAAAIALTGFIIAILPPLPAGSPAWGTAFIVSLIYPLALYPLLKSSRADYPFRALHFAPALMLVLWLLLQIGSSYVPLLGMLLAVYTWGWTAIAVVVAIGLLAWFCHSVIRQGVLRMGIIAAVLLPFLLLGLAGEQWNWSERITAGLSSGWNKVASSVSSSSVAGGSSSSSSSTIVAMNSSSSSAGYDHSAYRRRLHILDLGSAPEASSSSSSSSSRVSSMTSSSSSRVVAMASSSSSSRTSSASSSSSSARPGFFARVLAFFWGSPASTGSSSMSAMSSSRSVSSSSRMVAMSSSSSSRLVAMSSSSSSSRSSVIAAVSSSSKSLSSAQSSISSKPQRLPQTGFGLGEAALLLSAGYCGLLHARARRARQA